NPPFDRPPDPWPRPDPWPPPGRVRPGLTALRPPAVVSHGTRHITAHRPQLATPPIFPGTRKYQPHEPEPLQPPPTPAIIEHMFEDDGGVGTYDRDYGAGLDPGVCVMFETDADWDMALLAAADVHLEPLPVDEGVSDWWVRGEAELGLVVAC